MNTISKVYNSLDLLSQQLFKLLWWECEPIDVDDLDISDNDFFNIESDTGMSFDELVQQYTQLSDVAGINNVMDKVLKVGTEKEIHVFFMLLQGRTVKDMSKVFDKSRSTIDNYINNLLDKVIEG